jgi:hypothetical protein
MVWVPREDPRVPAVKSSIDTTTCRPAFPIRCAHVVTGPGHERAVDAAGVRLALHIARANPNRVARERGLRGFGARLGIVFSGQPAARRGGFVGAG